MLYMCFILSTSAYWEVFKYPSWVAEVNNKACSVYLGSVNELAVMYYSKLKKLKRILRSLSSIFRPIRCVNLIYKQVWVISRSVSAIMTIETLLVHRNHIYWCACRFCGVKYAYLLLYSFCYLLLRLYVSSYSVKIPTHKHYTSLFLHKRRLT